MIPYGKQLIDSEDIVAVNEVLVGDYLTTGPEVAAFEADLATTVGSTYAVAVANGTAALHIAALALLKPGDKVLTTPISFVATSNAILYAGAIPIFVDVDEQANIDLEACEVLLRLDRTIRAIFAVHFGGKCVDGEKLSYLKKTYGVMILEDASHALGAPGVARVGDVTTCSFHPVKHITTGEGGVVFTNSETTYQLLLQLRSHGIVRHAEEFEDKALAFSRNGKPNPWYYEMQTLGFNYRITDFQCALGRSQLKKLDRFLNRRKEIAATYNEAFRDFHHLKSLYSFDFDSAYHLFVVLIDFEAIGKERADVFAQLRAKQIAVQVHYIPINAQPYYRNRGYEYQKTPRAFAYYEQCLSLPIYPALGDDEQTYVIETLRKIVG